MLWSKCRLPTTACYYCIVIFMLLIIGCDGKTINKGAHGDMDAIEVDGTVYIETGLRSEMLPGDVKRIKDVLIEKVLPIIPETEKVELNEIINYLDHVEKKPRHILRMK